jgi:hypothetical protein
MIMSNLETVQGFNGTIRKVIINGEMLFSVIDIFKNHGSRSKNPHQEWERAKQRLEEQGFDISSRVCFYQFPGQGQRETPLITYETWNQIVATLGTRHFSTNKQQAIEVPLLHPLVCEFLLNEGWRIEHHYELPSGKEIDVVAKQGHQTLIIECKQSLQGHDFFNAIGQVLCYCDEFGEPAIPIIACYQGRINDYGRKRCASLGIQVLEV